VYANAPIVLHAKIAIVFPTVYSPFFAIRCFARKVIVQNRNNIVNALAKADIELIIIATCSGPEANIAKNLAIIMKNGAPGG